MIKKVDFVIYAPHKISFFTKCGGQVKECPAIRNMGMLGIEYTLVEKPEARVITLATFANKNKNSLELSNLANICNACKYKLSAPISSGFKIKDKSR